MTQSQKALLACLRVALGWMMLYAGMVKVIDPAWSAGGYLKGAKTFAVFYQWLASPSILPVVNFINEWGLTLLGISLVLGVFVRISSLLGAALMILYYLPVLDFPYPNPHAYLVDEHIVYALALLFFASIRAGRVGGLELWCQRLPICARFPRLREWLG